MKKRAKPTDRDEDGNKREEDRRGTPRTSLENFAAH